MAEFEGIQGNAFVEADSKPVEDASPQDQDQRPVNAEQAQQRPSEIEGSEATVPSEADSKPAQPSSTEQKLIEVDGASPPGQLQHSQHGTIMEVEGSEGKIYSEADSTPVHPVSVQDKQNVQEWELAQKKKGLS